MNKNRASGTRDLRSERLARELKANLAKRKAQARARQEVMPAPSANPDEPAGHPGEPCGEES